MAEAVAEQIDRDIDPNSHGETIMAYPVPRGGIPAAYAILGAMTDRLLIVDAPDKADIFIDDITDSGATRDRYLKEYPGRRFYSLVERTGPRKMDGWIVFPWEGSAAGSFEDNVTRLIQYVGEDPTREGLRETPARVAKAWKEWCSGYNQKPEDVLKVFEDGANGVDEMVVIRAPVYSHCEHHLAAIFGTAVVAYIPNGKIVGLSKIKRLVDVFARRLQVQERLTNQIADALEEHLAPKGAGVVIKARHLCMESRGVNVHDGEPTVTSALRGAIRERPEARAEFLALSK